MAEPLAPPSTTPSSRITGEGDTSGRLRAIRVTYDLQLPLIPGHTATIQRFVSLCPSWATIVNMIVCDVISHVGSKNLFPGAHAIDREVANTIKYFSCGRGHESHEIGLLPTRAWPEFSCFIDEHVNYFHRFAQEETRNIIFGLDGATPPLLPLDMSVEDRQLKIREMLTNKMFLHTVDDDNQVCMFQAPCIKEILRRIFWGPYELEHRDPWYSEIPPMAFVTVITLLLFSLHQIDHLGSDYPYTDFNDDNEMVHKYYKLARTMVEDVCTGEESGPPFDTFRSDLRPKIKAASIRLSPHKPIVPSLMFYPRDGD